MNTETPTPRTIKTPHRLYRVGDAVTMNGAAHTVVATDLAGITVETIDRDRAQVYVPARDMDRLLKPAP